jgi:hypothetical protein
MTDECVQDDPVVRASVSCLQKLDRIPWMGGSARRKDAVIRKGHIGVGSEPTISVLEQ